MVVALSLFLRSKATAHRIAVSRSCVDPPLTAAEIKSLSGVNYVFRNTMFGIDSETGMRIRRVILDRPLAAKKPLARLK